MLVAADMFTRDIVVQPDGTIWFTWQCQRCFVRGGSITVSHMFLACEMHAETAHPGVEMALS